MGLACDFNDWFRLTLLHILADLLEYDEVSLVVKYLQLLRAHIFRNLFHDSRPRLVVVGIRVIQLEEIVDQEINQYAQVQLLLVFRGTNECLLVMNLLQQQFWALG